MHNSINIRGERGDYRELNPLTFILSCPTCGCSRECAQVKLFTTTARGLTCSSCKKSTSSTRWKCQHGILWPKCSIHREQGFRCGANRKPPLERPKTWLGSMSLKALKNKQARLNRLGSLGEPSSASNFSSNLVGAHSSRRTLVQKKRGRGKGYAQPQCGKELRAD